MYNKPTTIPSETLMLITCGTNETHAGTTENPLRYERVPCICHFGNWQIHPFTPKGRIMLGIRRKREIILIKKHHKWKILDNELSQLLYLTVGYNVSPTNMQHLTHCFLMSNNKKQWVLAGNLHDHRTTYRLISVT